MIYEKYSHFLLLILLVYTPSHDQTIADKILEIRAVEIPDAGLLTK